jgi:hypothetical protein
MRSSLSCQRALISELLPLHHGDEGIVVGGMEITPAAPHGVFSSNL